MVAQETVNLLVGGSKPSLGANFREYGGIGRRSRLKLKFEPYIRNYISGLGDIGETLAYNNDGNTEGTGNRTP